MDKPRKIILIPMIITAIIMLFISIDIIRFASKIVDREQISEDVVILPQNEPITTYYEEEEEIPPEQPICEYTNVISEIVAVPEPGDDIQQIIGYQNNKVGLYIYAEVKEFSELADELANSNGGDWGYVLIPYNVKDYNHERWEHLFLLLEELHLIPIIQLYDIDIDDKKKTNEQILDSAEFLNSLKWPIKHRYVSVYNEPNDAKFWKGELDPEGYAVILDKTIDAFNTLDDDFFIMNGAFNASARTGKSVLDERTYLIRMDKKVPGIFHKLDGWASHPYPQPNFSGSPKATGRDSIRAYEWELAILQDQFGVNTNELPVFITETGWAHKESEAHSDGERVQYSLTEHQVADNFRYAFENVWLPDDQVVAVTPFTIKYDPPFDHFSWVTKNLNKYPQFLAIENMPKVKGKPPVVTFETNKIMTCE